MKRQVAITGVGAVSAFGVGTQSMLEGLRSGVVPREERCGISVAPAPPQPVLEQAAGEIRYPKPGRPSLLARLAAREAFTAASIRTTDLDPERCGIVINRNFGQQDIIQRYYETMWGKGCGSVSGLQFVQTIANTVLGGIAIEWKLRGPALLCMGQPAPTVALDLIRDGKADVILAGCMDELSGYVTESCAATRFASHPDSAWVPGEGSVFFVIESLDHAVGRGAGVLALLSGYGSVQDRGASRDILSRSCADIAEAVTRALRDAACPPGDIGFIVRAGDAFAEVRSAEREGIATALGSQPPLDFTNRALGETWGAAGGFAIARAIAEFGNLPQAESAIAMHLDYTGQNTAMVVSKAA